MAAAVVRFSVYAQEVGWPGNPGGTIVQDAVPPSIAANVGSAVSACAMARRACGLLNGGTFEFSTRKWLA